MRSAGRALLLGCVISCDGNGTKYVGAHYPPLEGGSSGVLPGTGGNDAARECSGRVAPGLQPILLTSSNKSRQFYLSVPASYQEQLSYPVVFGLHSRDQDGTFAREYLGLESVEPEDWAVFVYPDGLWREWSEEDSAIGWQNGPATDFYGGTEDLVFMRDIITHLEEMLCLNVSRLFATGHGWGGDFSAVMGCYLGDLFDAAVPVFANAPYFLPTSPDARPPCVGDVAVWVYHGRDDPVYPLEYGESQRDFWTSKNGCSLDNASVLEFAGMVQDDDCVEYACSGPRTRFCAYTATVRRDIPGAYFAAATVEFFRSLL